MQKVKDKYLVKKGTKIVSTEKVENFRHFVCACVLHEQLKNGCDTYYAAYFHVYDRIVRYSGYHSSSDEFEPVTYEKNIFVMIFNERYNYVPFYVAYWLNNYYSDVISDGADAFTYNKRHYEMYNTLKNLAIERYREEKHDEKETIQYKKHRRRALCQAYKSGDYEVLFNLYGKPLAELPELERTYDVLTDLFNKEFNNSEYDLALAYQLGVMQGERNASGGQLTAADERG